MKSKEFLPLAFLALVCLGAGRAQAHPVAYKGATEFMTELDGRSSRHMITHSPTPYLGLGPALEIFDNEHSAISGQIGWLAKRWNMPRSQGNLYLIGNLGQLKTASSGWETLGSLGVQADWEDRNYYLLGESTFIRSSGDFKKDRWKVRAGFAPYLGEFRELNTWFIFELNGEYNAATRPRATPFLRFYYRNVLWEIGSSLQGDFLFNFMLRLFSY